jgi:hypothetical protein
MNQTMNQTEHVEVKVKARGHLPRLLAEAEATLIATACTSGGAGILVTRHSPGHYTLALSKDVPFGETREHSLL